MPDEQRWLSLDGIATTLSMTHNAVQRLAREGALVTIGKGNSLRFLDPTPEYANKLRFAEVIYSREQGLPKDLSLAGLLTANEIAVIMGWTLAYARTYLIRYKVQGVKLGMYKLYPVKTVRDILWRRQDRKTSSSRAPFLIEHMIQFFLKYHAAESEDLPTDSQFAADDDLQRKLTRMLKMKSPAREQALQEFWAKVETAKAVAAALRSPSTTAP